MPYVSVSEEIVLPSGMLLSLFTARLTVHMQFLQSHEQNMYQKGYRMLDETNNEQETDTLLF